MADLPQWASLLLWRSLMSTPSTAHHYAAKNTRSCVLHFEKEAAFEVVYIGYLFFTLRKLFGSSRYIQLAAPDNLSERIFALTL